MSDDEEVIYPIDDVLAALQHAEHMTLELIEARNECDQMPVKMARSAPLPSFGMPEVTAAIRAATALPERRKSAKIRAASRFI